MSRIVTAVIVLPVLIASIWIAPLAPLFVALAITAMGLGIYEFWMLAKQSGLKPEIAIGTIFATMLFATFYLHAIDWLPPIIAAFTITTLIAAMLRRSRPGENASFAGMLASAGATLLGVSYIALLGGYLVAVRTAFPMPLAARLLSFFFLVLMCSDTAAYYTGRALGRRKLAPSISPGKTWEGAAGGMAASLLAAVIAHYWFFPELRLAAAIPLAAVMNILGVLGDLTESAIKRGAGAKDAAQILPGHGGLLDRLDSLLFNAPLIYYFGRLYFKY